MTTGQLKDFFNSLWLACLCVARRQVDKADPHLPLALGTTKRVGLIDLSDKVGPALFLRKALVLSPCL